MTEQNTITVTITRDPIAADLPLPCLMTEGSAAADLRAALETTPFVLQPGQRALINTGLRMEIPMGYEGQVRPRSGLAIKHGVTLLNTPGTIDSDYRGLLQVILMNFGAEPFQIQHGDRIAQLVIAPVTRAIFAETETLSDTQRGEGGFGSSGVK